MTNPSERIAQLEELLAKREAALDAISYMCADLDVNYSMADSMLDDDESDPLEMKLSNARVLAYAEGGWAAGSAIDKIIKASGYEVKDRLED